jgi:hypothetical protein
MPIRVRHVESFVVVASWIVGRRTRIVAIVTKAVAMLEKVVRGGEEDDCGRKRTTR